MRFADFDGTGAIGFWEWDFRDSLIVPSNRLHELLDYGSGEFPAGEFLIDLVHPEDLPLLEGKVEAFRAGALPLLQSQHRMRCGDGDWKWVLIRGEVADRDKQSRPLSARGFVLDATSNVRLLESLLYEKDSLAATLSAMRDALLATDSLGTVTMMNDAAVRLLGAEDEIGPLGAVIYHILPLFRHSDGTAVTGYIERAVEEGRQLEYTHNVALRLPGRPPMDVSVVVSPMHVEEETRTGAVVVVEDVTEKRRHEEELRQVQKLDSLARLARGISHDLNDALAALLGEVSLFRERMNEGVGCGEELMNIESSAEKIRKISQQLSVFGTQEPPLLEGTSVEELVRDAVQYALRGSSIAVSYTIETPTWNVSVDQEQFGQLLQNVVMNARDAMDDVGTIHVEVRNGAPISSRGRGGSPSVQVMIADEGPGIPEENLPFIFDPYFTTKDRAGGLGLTIARSIVSSHGGYLEIDSEVGMGTTVEITIPAISSVGESGSTFSPMVLPRNKRVLILEDDELVLSVIDRMVRLLGSKPTAVVGGEYAVAKARDALDRGYPFDLMITDVAIRGGMSGLDALRQIHTFQPDLPTVLTSAFAGVPEQLSEGDPGLVAILPKPFTLDDLRGLMSTVFAH
ncbi:MAG: ATP-binding protein [Spirochaetaceae bacterium]